MSRCEQNCKHCGSPRQRETRKKIRVTDEVLRAKRGRDVKECVRLPSAQQASHGSSMNYSVFHLRGARGFSRARSLRRMASRSAKASRSTVVENARGRPLKSARPALFQVPFWPSQKREPRGSRQGVHDSAVEMPHVEWASFTLTVLIKLRKVGSSMAWP
jgi:hypothetical protein